MFLFFALVKVSYMIVIFALLGILGFSILFLTPLPFLVSSSSASSPSILIVSFAIFVSNLFCIFSLFLLVLFALLSVSSGISSPSLLVPSALSVPYLNILGLPALPLGSTLVSGPFLLGCDDVSIGAWDEDADIVALRLCLLTLVGCNASSPEEKIGMLSGKTLGGLMWCICSVTVGLDCLKTSPLWFIAVSSLLFIAWFLLCSSSAFICEACCVEDDGTVGVV